jgi:hypothetical protein
MTPNGTPQNLTTSQGPVQDGKKPYAAPRLRHLGSVRELTLGPTPGVGEPLGGKFQAAKM